MELAFLQSEISVLSPSIRAKKKQEISLNELLPVKRTEKKYKIFPASS